MTDFISFKTLKRSSKPNNYLLAPPDMCLAAEPDDPAPIFANSARGLFSQLSELIASERRWSDLKADSESLQLKFIARTPLMGFKDDVDILVIAPGDAGGQSESGASLAIYSRSRVGYSDLGANKKRVESIIARLTAN